MERHHIQTMNRSKRLVKFVMTSKFQECFAIFPKISKKEDTFHFVGIEKSEFKPKFGRALPMIPRDVDGQFVCDYCDKRYLSPSGLTAHRKSVHEGVNFVCQFCQKNFRKKAHMVTHVNSKHFGIRYTCQLCDNEFVSQDGLKFHERHKHDENFQKYQCTKCPKSFTQKGALKAHFQGYHENIHHQCTFCEYKTVDKSNLNKHIKKFHQDKVKTEPPITEVKTETDYLVKVENIDHFW